MVENEKNFGENKKAQNTYRYKELVERIGHTFHGNVGQVLLVSLHLQGQKCTFITQGIPISTSKEVRTHTLLCFE